MSGEATIAVEHRRFGRLEVPERDVLRFDALPGFPSARRGVGAAAALVTGGGVLGRIVQSRG